MKNLVVFALLLISGFAPQGAFAAAVAVPGPMAKASEPASVFIRAKGGPSFYSNIDPVTMAWGVGLDLGFRLQGGFGVAGAAKMNFLTSATQAIDVSTSTRTEVTSLFFGVIPNYSVSKGIATITFGLGLGVLSVTTQMDTFLSTSSISTPETTRSRFAIAPGFDVDIEIASGVFVTIGAQYIVGLGESPLPGLITPMAGIGYQF